MIIKVKLFATLRDQVGAAEMTLELPQGATVSDAGRALGERMASPEALSAVAYAVNREYAPAATVLHDNDELAIIPPVSGG